MYRNLYEVELRSDKVFTPEEHKVMLWELLDQVFHDLSGDLHTEEDDEAFILVGDGSPSFHHSLLDGLQYLAEFPYHPWWEEKYLPGYTEEVREAFLGVIDAVKAAKKALSKT